MEHLFAPGLPHVFLSSFPSILVAMDHSVVARCTNPFACDLR
jgi:hypothetical protein